MFKHFVAACAAFTAIAIAVPSVSSDPARADTLLESAARSCATPDQLAGFLKKNLVFQEDLALFGEVDYWQSPEEVIARGRGDCEDYALLARDLLIRAGKQAFIFSLYGEGGYAHTVCVFKDGKGYSVLNQDKLVHYPVSTLEELAGRIQPRWEWGAVAERHGHRGRAVRIVRKTSTR